MVLVLVMIVVVVVAGSRSSLLKKWLVLEGCGGSSSWKNKWAEASSLNRTCLRSELYPAVELHLQDLQVQIRFETLPQLKCVDHLHCQDRHALSIILYYSRTPFKLYGMYESTCSTEESFFVLS